MVISDVTSVTHFGKFNEAVKKKRIFWFQNIKKFTLFEKRSTVKVKGSNE